MKKRIIGLGLVFAILFSFCPTVKKAIAASIRLNRMKLTLDEGTSTTLRVNGTKKKIKWSSSNKSVATVTSKGKLFAHSAGKATITAKVEKKRLKCRITVKAVIDEYTRVQTERFDIVARVIMNTGNLTTDENGDRAYMVDTGIQHDDFYDDDDNLQDVYYVSSFMYYPDEEYIDMEFSHDFTSPNFDSEADYMRYQYVRIYRDDVYTCDARSCIYYTYEDGSKTTGVSELTKEPRSNIYHGYNNLAWDIEGENKGSESWKISNNSANSGIDLWYNDADQFLYKLIGYRLTDLGFNY